MLGPTTTRKLPLVILESRESPAKVASVKAANLQCSACGSHFVLNPHKPKVEISCPACDRKLRMNKRPGEREVLCPACDVSFKVKF